MTVHVVEDPRVAGVVRVSCDPAMPGPRVGVLGAVHGNEVCGLEAIRALRRMAETRELVPRAGTLVLIHGNPEATAQGRRFTEGGEDMNRILDYAFVEALVPEAWQAEHHRAVALRPILESLDALLDLHSATEDTPAFAIVNGVAGSTDLAARCGVRAMTHAWEQLAERVTISVLARRGRPGVSVECGRHDAAAAVAEAQKIALRFLCATGAVLGPVPEPDPVMRLTVTDVLIKPTSGFRFASPIRGLDPLPAGHLVGTDGAVELRVARDAIALLPNDGADVGDDMLYLATQG